MVKKEFSNLCLNGILLIEKLVWGADQSGLVPCSPLPIRVLKFNVDGASRGKPRPTGIRCVLHNSKGEVLLMFSKHVEVCDSNVVEVLAILEALRLFS